MLRCLKINRRSCESCGGLVRKIGRVVCSVCHYRRLSEKRSLPLSQRYTTWGVGINVGNSQGVPLPDSPTKALPGSEEKILVLMERAVKGCQLFHPEDEVKMEKQLR